MRRIELRPDRCPQRVRGVFSGLEAPHFVRLEREKSVHKYERGQVVFYEGNDPFAVYCIHSGRVKLYKVGKKSEPQVIRLLGPGDILGFRPLLADEPYAATAEAVEPSVICCIPKQVFFDLLRESGKFSFTLLAMMARELRVSEEQAIALAQESVTQRTARFLVSFLESSGEKSGGEIKLEVPLLRKDIAQMIGTTPESLSRALKYFVRRGAIRLSRAEIYVKNPSMIRAMVNGA